MKKVIVIGSGGAGKSTLARRLGGLTGIPVHHLDTIFWKPGWVSISREELTEKINEILPQQHWIIDGNYISTIDIRLAAADTVIYLDFPSIVCLWGIIKRRFAYANKRRPDITEGCEEKIDWEFFRWVLTFRKRNRKKILEALEQNKQGKEIIILQNRRAAERYLETLARGNQ